MFNKKGLSVAIIITISFVGIIAAIIGYNFYVNNKIKNAIDELKQVSIKDFTAEHKQGDFPEEMQGFLSESKEDLSKLCISHPNDLWDQAKMVNHYEGVLLYKETDIKKYKKELLPKLRKLIGKYSNPTTSSSSDSSDSRPYAPDLNKYQNTLIEWCLIANTFEEKDDGNSAFILSYGAARMALRLLSDYADGASKKNIDTANHILRCACCQLIYIANSGLKHNPKMVKAIAKDLYKMSEEYQPFSKSIEYDLNILKNSVQELANKGNYAASSISGKADRTKFSHELNNHFKSLFDICDSSYHKINEKMARWDRKLREGIVKYFDKNDLSNLPLSVANALLSNNLPDYTKQKLAIDETRVILIGAATVLATYEYIGKFRGNFNYSGELIARSTDSSCPTDPLSGRIVYISLPGSNIMSKHSEGCVYSINLLPYDQKDDIVFLTDQEFQLKYRREEYKSDYFDEDEAISKMTPQEKANYEKIKQESEKQKLEAKKRVEELVKEYRTKRVHLDSSDDFYCGYKPGQKPQNVNESYYEESKYNGSVFIVEIKEPFLGEFPLAEVHVDNSKKLRMVTYTICCNTTSERATAMWHIRKAIEGSEGFKTVKEEDDFEQSSFEYLREKDNTEIALSLCKGLDGGGTITMYVCQK